MCRRMEGGGVGEVVNSYDPEKAWSSINRSILSGYQVPIISLSHNKSLACGCKNLDSKCVSVFTVSHHEIFFVL